MPILKVFADNKVNLAQVIVLNSQMQSNCFCNVFYITCEQTIIIPPQYEISLSVFTFVGMSVRLCTNYW